MTRVERVHRLSQVQHDEVGQVDGQVDRPLVDRLQHPSQLVGRGAAVDPVNAQTAVARTGVAVVDDHLDASSILRQLHRLTYRAELAAIDCGELTREAVVPPEVRAMVDGLVVDLKHPVLDRTGVDEPRADLRLCWQGEDPVGFLTQAQLGL